ncbi:MAG TPA: class I SAM-dependent methyltransferase [Thermomicrobiales bacterium]|nr:class I SAM-dependent methyltransferase [Thermomicrobiales bacterium]
MSASDELIGLRFDTVGDLYHEVRPRYPSEIWARLFDVTKLQPGTRVLEIGAGTGIATAELVARGCHVTALEPGATMAAIIERDLGWSGQVDVRIGKLEELDWTGEPFDLALGATSLHWVDRPVLHARLRELVRAGGFAALVYYQHVLGGTMAFFDAAQECYWRHAPSIAGPGLRETAADLPSAQVLDDLEGFQEYHREHWLRDISSDREHYLALLSTYSGHLALPDHERAALLACIGDLIDDRFGGRITKRYRYDLVVMQRLTNA